MQGAGDVLRSMKGVLDALRQVKVHACVVGVVVRVRRRVVTRGRDFIFFFFFPSLYLLSSVDSPGRFELGGCFCFWFIFGVVLWDVLFLAGLIVD